MPEAPATDAASTVPNWRGAALRAALAGIAYYVAARLTILLALPPEGVAILWPCNAIVLAALLLSPPRWWLPIAAVVVPAEILADLDTFPLPVSTGLGLANLTEVLVAAVLTRGYGNKEFDFVSTRGIGRFLLFGPLIASMTSAFGGAGILCTLPDQADFLTLWRLWWFSDGLGLLILTPALVIWLQRDETDAAAAWRQRRAEAVLLLGLLMAGCLMVFGDLHARLSPPLATPILLIPFPLWAAVRFGTRGSTLAVLLLSVATTRAVSHGAGPYAGLPGLEAVLRAQEFLFIAAASAIPLAAMLKEAARQQKNLSLRERAIAALSEGVVIADANHPDLPVTYVNRAFEEMTGYSHAETIGRNCRFLRGDDSEQPGLEMLRQAVRDQCAGRAVIRNYRKDGSLFWNELNIAPVRDAKGTVTHFIGVQHDLTEIKRVESELRATQEHLALINQELEQRVAERTLALEQANRELAVLAATDPLTGALNRRQFIERADQEAARSRRNGDPLSLLMFDLDHFKTVNDVHGHAVGDEVLKLLVNTATEVLRASDLLGRFGGEEFVVLLPETARDQARDAAERLRRATAAMRVPIPTGWLRCSISIGVTAWDIGAHSLDQALNHADSALYRAKAAGRNRVEMFEG